MSAYQPIQDDSFILTIIEEAMHALAQKVDPAQHILDIQESVPQNLQESYYYWFDVTRTAGYFGQKHDMQFSQEDIFEIGVTPKLLEATWVEFIEDGQYKCPADMLHSGNRSRALKELHSNPPIKPEMVDGLVSEMKLWHLQRI